MVIDIVPTGGGTPTPSGGGNNIVKIEDKTEAEKQALFADIYAKYTAGDYKSITSIFVDFKDRLSMPDGFNVVFPQIPTYVDTSNHEIVYFGLANKGGDIYKYYCYWKNEGTVLNIGIDLVEDAVAQIDETLTQIIEG